MLPGHASLPNGFGLDYIDADGHATIPGVAPNSLTSADWRDAFAGTPWHKHVPARLTHSARRRRLRIPESWPWAAAVVSVFANIAAIPLPG